MALSNFQIERVLKKHKSKLFYDVIAYDTFDINHCPYFPIVIIANTHPHYVERGGHWIGLYIDRKKNGIYFDSTGTKPFGKFYDFFKLHARTTVFNTMLIQSSDFTCGYFVVFFALKIEKMKTLHRLLRLFGKCKDPDKMVMRYFDKL